jgi:glucan-binding YG repeat protein
LKESDPSCATLQSDKPECPFDENIKRICMSTDWNLQNQYGQFCSFKKVNGMCLNEYMEREQEDKERQVDKDAEEARRQQEELDKQRQEQEQAAEKRRQEEERQKEADRIAQQQRQIELEKEWVRTRGCKFYDANIPQSVIDMAKARNVDWWTTSIPCQYAKVFQNSKVGDVVKLTTSGKQLKFLGWIPETNPNTELITPLRGN